MSLLKRVWHRNTIISQFYNASDIWRAKTVTVAGDRLIIQSPVAGELDIGGRGYAWSQQYDIDISVALNWDTVTPTNYTVAGNRAGGNFYVYACGYRAGYNPRFLLSANSTMPDGYTALNSRKVAGFSCLCAAVNHETALSQIARNTLYNTAGQRVRPNPWNGNKILKCKTPGTSHATTEVDVSGIAANVDITDGSVVWTVEIHPAEGYAAGDIIPPGVWDQAMHRPIASPENMIFVPILNKWVGVVPLTGTYPNLASVVGGTVAVNLTPRQYQAALADLNMRPSSDTEYQLFSKGSNEGFPVSGGTPVLTGGYSTANGYRALSHYWLEGCCGHHNHVVTYALAGDMMRLFGGRGESGANYIGPYKNNTFIAIDTASGTTSCCRAVSETIGSYRTAA